MVLAAFSPWRRRLGEPTFMISQYVESSVLIRRGETSVTVIWMQNIERRIRKLMICERQVDSPAPDTPIPKPNIRIGSPIIFRIPPVVRPIIAYIALPS